MKPKAIIVAIAALLLVPAGLEAQTIGFGVGIRSSGYGPVVPFGGGINAGYVGFNNPYGNAHSVTRNNPYINRHNVPRGGFIIPQRPFAPTATVIQAGAGFIVGRPDRPLGQRYIPFHQPAIPTHPTPAPVIIVTTGRNRAYPPNYPRAFVPGPSITVPGARILGNRGNRNRGTGSVVITGSGVRIGSTRAEVLEYYGTPIVSRVNRQAEALVFRPTTITIQNGVVTQMKGR
jgi:hypothetical protein